MEESRYAIKKDQLEKEQCEEKQRQEELCREEELGEEIQLKEICFEKIRFEKGGRPQIQPQGFEVCRARSESDEEGTAEVRSQREEGHEPEAGDCDRIVRSPQKGSKGSPCQEEVVEMNEG
jgi:hypothetical protein